MIGRLSALVRQWPASLAGALQVQVPEQGAGILWIDGQAERLLLPGSHAFWKFNRNVSVELVDLRLPEPPAACARLAGSRIDPNAD